MTAPRVLIVGAGAVGVSYAYAFARGGAQVSFYVRPPRVEETRAGIPLHDLPTFGRTTTHMVRAHEVLSSPDDVAARDFDQVWLTVPSTSLAGEWLPALCAAAPDAVIVSLSPGLADRGTVAAAAGAERVVASVIVLVAWHGTLREDDDDRGVRAWFPPLVSTPCSGPRAREVRDLFASGGIKARVVDDAAAQAAPGAALLQAIVAADECAGWSLRALMRSPLLALAVRAGREAATIGARTLGRRPPRLPLVRPLLLRLVAPIAPRLFPGDLEVYLRVHFTKVGAQTSRALDEYLACADDQDLPADNVRLLRDELARARESGRG